MYSHNWLPTYPVVWAITLSVLKAMRRPDNLEKAIETHTFFRVRFSLGFGGAWLNIMETKKENLESAKRMLIDEFKENIFTREKPFGNSGSDRRLIRFVIESVLAKSTSEEMWEWFEENIIKEYDVTDVPKSTFDFAHRVLKTYLNSQK